MEVKKLVIPLCNYSERIFKEGDNNQETANSWEISENRLSAAFSIFKIFRKYLKAF